MTLNQMVHKHRSQSICHAFPRVTCFVNSRNHFLYLVEILQQSIKWKNQIWNGSDKVHVWNTYHENREITRVFGKMWCLQKIIGDKDMVAQNCHKLLLLCAFWTNLCWSDDNLTWKVVNVILPHHLLGYSVSQFIASTNLSSSRDLSRVASD